LASCSTQIFGRCERSTRQCLSNEIHSPTTVNGGRNHWFGKPELWAVRRSAHFARFLLLRRSSSRRLWAFYFEKLTHRGSAGPPRGIHGRTILSLKTCCVSNTLIASITFAAAKTMSGLILSKPNLAEQRVRESNDTCCSNTAVAVARIRSSVNGL